MQSTHRAYPGEISPTAKTVLGHIPETAIPSACKDGRCQTTHHRPNPTPPKQARTSFTSFTDYLQNAQDEPFFQSLLANVNHMEHEETQSLAEVLQSPAYASHLVIASDGGCISYIEMGSFGWSLGDFYSTNWNNKGSAPGSPNPSFRAEGYGMLSVLLFLLAFIEYHHLKNTKDSKVRIYCDNLALITTTKKLLKYDDHFPALHT